MSADYDKPKESKTQVEASARRYSGLVSAGLEREQVVTCRHWPASRVSPTIYESYAMRTGTSPNGSDLNCFASRPPLRRLCLEL